MAELQEHDDVVQLPLDALEHTMRRLGWYVLWRQVLLLLLHGCCLCIAPPFHDQPTLETALVLPQHAA